MVRRSLGGLCLLANTRQKMLRRINQLLQDISRNKNVGIGKPEQLKGELSGFWSRRIDETNRLVYRVQNEILEVLSCKGHYDE
jgi:toxin YoeB